MKSTFYIRVNYPPRPPDSTLDSFNSHLSNRPNSSETHDGTLNKKYFGMLDSYRGGTWKLVLEKNYSYYSDDGLHFPFICEYNQMCYFSSLGKIFIVHSFVWIIYDCKIYIIIHCDSSYIWDVSNVVSIVSFFFISSY